MERVSLEASVRQHTGKEGARRLRRAGAVPAVVYGRGREPVAVAVESRALRTALHTHAGTNVLIDLDIRVDGGADRQLVMVKELQRDIFSQEIIHVDFQAISLEETLEAHVPVVLVGTPRGVTEGGLLDQHLREVLVECLPTQIPERLEVDVGELRVGQAVHAGELKMPEGVTLLTPPGEVVATVLAPRVEEAPPTAPPAEAAAAPAPEAAAGEKSAEKSAAKPPAGGA
ncbi:MAG: 50S ribosomal protein L25 [Armatimonadota bacterium]|nr:50S ribosomal protein L25 [Armatimonadota bacterium]MDR7426037.1 50S ribosomal protein L25 [Armatimonadota bacterium]MDR7463199.1 50S ribosomal protein L25 [Armatimonadota bacterium]MDR7469421.1 50S ribosomal protein L25 [Armatimonadota bacterium]MDR7474238.1 50S ribosomal protein L25 [Armatimonadota bacterium]